SEAVRPTPASRFVLEPIHFLLGNGHFHGLVQRPLGHMDEVPHRAAGLVANLGAFFEVVKLGQRRLVEGQGSHGTPPSWAATAAFYHHPRERRSQSHPFGGARGLVGTGQSTNANSL